MCGIAGILNLTCSEPVLQAELAKMISMLQHRGPDGTGYYTCSGLGLGHARLSIIDIEGGKQPIHNEDKSIWVVFNGEIFNYIELRKELQQQGHIFYTQTDTEVIIHLYEEYGEGFVHHLNGQFAIALWDDVNRRLVLTRDRVGITPLYYMQHDGRLLFASEIKAILPITRTKPSLNPHALDQLMTFWSPLSPETIFQDVYEISPGEQLTIHDGRIKNQKYWNWSFPEYGEYYTGSVQRISEELHDLLVDSTRIRLRSDVPVGAYLSGGLDSSILVSLIHHYGGAPLRTFSIGFQDDSLDESSFQREMIEHLGAKHSRVNCNYYDIADQFTETIRATESPILRTAPVPMKILSSLVNAQNYKVVMTGEGADEVFGGYDIFKEGKIRQFWSRQPASKIRPLLLKRLYPYLDISKSQGQAYLKKFFGVALEIPDLSYFSHIPRWTTTSKCKEFFSEGLKTQLIDNAIELIEKKLPKSISHWHHFNRAQYIEAKSLMAGYLLSSQGDRMLMANSVEGRFPYLDHRVIEFANALHPSMKMKVLNEKYILKEAMRRYLPKSIINRYKQPYRAPDIPAFFNGKTPDYVEEMLAEDTIKKYGYFDAKKVGHLKKKIEHGRAIGQKDNMALVGILSTQVWHWEFVENYHNNYRTISDQSNAGPKNKAIGS